MILVTGANGFVGYKIMQMCKDVLACPSLRGVSEEEIKRKETSYGSFGGGCDAPRGLFLYLYCK